MCSACRAKTNAKHHVRREQNHNSLISHTVSQLRLRFDECLLAASAAQHYTAHWHKNDVGGGTCASEGMVEVGGTCSSLFTRLPRYLWWLKTMRKDKEGG